MLSNDALSEFISIYVDEYGEEVKEEKALFLAINLLTIFDQVYKPIPAVAYG